MSTGLDKFIHNYCSLWQKICHLDLVNIIQFCIFFQSDDVDLFYDYCDIINIGQLSIDKMIELYARRYNLNPNRDIDKIMFQFIHNTIVEGLSFHLNSSANYDSIMKLGLGISAIGLKTDERCDYERLQGVCSPELFSSLEPFCGDKRGSKVYYSNIPILSARYGDCPEWIKMLNINSNIDLIREQLKREPAVEKFVFEILDKYHQKYDYCQKQLFLFPNPLSTIVESKLDAMIEKMSPWDIISYFYYKVLTQKDLYTQSYIPSSEIAEIDLNSYDISYRNALGEIEVKKGTVESSFQY